MKILLQRAARASVTVDGEVAGAISRGLVLFTGIGRGDNESTLSAMAEKVALLRVFPDQRGRFHRSLLDVQGGALLIPQFTLFADTSKGRRPEFFGAMPPREAAPLFERFITAVSAAGVTQVAAGVFGAMMTVSVENDGPVSLILEN